LGKSYAISEIRVLKILGILAKYALEFKFYFTNLIHSNKFRFMYILLLRAQSSFHMNCRFNFHPSELVTPENLAKWVVKSFSVPKAGGD